MTAVPESKLVSYLTDVHSIEEQALAQMRKAPDLAGDPEIARVVSTHVDETERHEKAIAARLEAHGAEPSTTKDVIAKVGAAAMLLFARLNPDTPGKLVVHAYSYEHLEMASHEIVALAAERANDHETAATSRAIAAEERAMGERLAGVFDQAVDASLRELSPDDLREQVTKYLGDAYAIETQALRLLEGGNALAGVPSLTQVFAVHRQETRAQRDRVEARLTALNSSPNRLKSTALGFGGLNWGAIFGAQPDTPAKLAGFAFAFEHLENAGYELLARVAERAGDPETASMAREIAGEERTAAAKVRATFADAVDASVS